MLQQHFIYLNIAINPETIVFGYLWTFHVYGTVNMNENIENIKKFQICDSCMNFVSFFI